MRIKLDENLPSSLVETLEQLGHDADSVPEEGLQGSSDPDVWAAAQAAKRFLVTQDLDFSDVRKFPPGTHCGLLLVRLANPSRRALKAYIESLFRTEDVERWARCFVVATDTKIRVRRSEPDR
jgi:predicted nuclease of predicted toxin-antitoxin system